LSKWIVQSRNNEFDSHAIGDGLSTSHQGEKRPQDWNQEERLNIIMECPSLDEKRPTNLAAPRVFTLITSPNGNTP